MTAIGPAQRKVLRLELIALQRSAQEQRQRGVRDRALGRRIAELQATLHARRLQVPDVDARRQRVNAAFRVARAAQQLVDGVATIDAVRAALDGLAAVDPTWVSTAPPAPTAPAAPPAPPAVKRRRSDAAAPKLTLKARVEAWVMARRGSFGPQTVADALEVPARAVGPALRQLVDAGRITRVTTGTYVHAKVMRKPLSEDET